MMALEARAGIEPTHKGFAEFSMKKPYCSCWAAISATDQVRIGSHSPNYRLLAPTEHPLYAS